MYSYNEFAYIYDELMTDFNYQDWANYIFEIFNKNKINPENVLEMACGTGNLTYEFAKKGYKVTAFDLSEEMLSIAYEKLGQYKRVKLLNLDMTSFKLSDKYQAVVSICDSINYITSEEELLEVFNNVYSHLEEDGIFIFDINSYYKLTNIIGNNTFVNDNEENFYVWENYFEENEKIVNFYLTFFVKDDSGMYERFDEHHKERAYTVFDIENNLKKAGFKDIKYYEAFSFNEVNNKTNRINFVAIK